MNLIDKALKRNAPKDDRWPTAPQEAPQREPRGANSPRIDHPLTPQDAPESLRPWRTSLVRPALLIAGAVVLVAAVWLTVAWIQGRIAAPSPPPANARLASLRDRPTPSFEAHTRPPADVAAAVPVTSPELSRADALSRAKALAEARVALAKTVDQAHYHQPAATARQAGASPAPPAKALAMPDRAPTPTARTHVAAAGPAKPESTAKAAPPTASGSSQMLPLLKSPGAPSNSRAVKRPESAAAAPGPAPASPTAPRPTMSQTPPAIPPLPPIAPIRFDPTPPAEPAPTTPVPAKPAPATPVPAKPAPATPVPAKATPARTVRKKPTPAIVSLPSFAPIPITPRPIAAPAVPIRTKPKPVAAPAPPVAATPVPAIAPVAPFKPIRSAGTEATPAIPVLPQPPILAPRVPAAARTVAPVPAKSVRPATPAIGPVAPVKPIHSAGTGDAPAIPVLPQPPILDPRVPAAPRTVAPAPAESVRPATPSPAMPVLPAPRAHPNPQAPVRYHLSAVLRDASGSVAVVNGLFVRVGQRIGTAKVVWIDASSVVLEQAGRRIKLKL